MGKIKALIGLLVVGGGFYVAWNMIPPYFNNYQFQDTLDEIARRNSYTTSTDDDVKKVVIIKAADDNINLKEDQINITRTSSGIGISVKYHIHIEMIVHPVDLDFTANSINKRI
ncbi:MAG TPA: hypothetical protein VGH51_20815 [Candidatus Angelobacter sp.]|jgi:hypothetical protein